MFICFFRVVSTLRLDDGCACMQVPSEAIERHSTVCAFLERRIEADTGLSDRLTALATLTAEAAGEHAGIPFLALYTCLESACRRVADLPAGGALEPCQVLLDLTLT